MVRTDSRKVRRSHPVLVGGVNGSAPSGERVKHGSDNEYRRIDRQ
jgi:hypothetical protein